MEIVTCFSQSAHALREGGAGAAAVTALRKAEDEHMISLLGPTPPKLHYLDLPDAPLRPGRSYQNLYGRLILAPERTLVQRIREAIRQLLRPDFLLLYPLGIGLHVDHLLTRMACDGLARGHEAWACYEDQPYQALASIRRAEVQRRGMKPFLLTVAEGKDDLMECYPSQLVPDHRTAILRYSHGLAGDTGFCERLWTAARPRA